LPRDLNSGGLLPNIERAPARWTPRRELALLRGLCEHGWVDPKDLACLRRARDLMDREYDQPLDVPALARVALMSTAHFARQFRAAYGETPYGYLMTGGSSGPRRCCAT